MKWALIYIILLMFKISTVFIYSKRKPERIIQIFLIFSIIIFMYTFYLITFQIGIPETEDLGGFGDYAFFYYFSIFLFATFVATIASMIATKFNRLLRTLAISLFFMGLLMIIELLLIFQLHNFIEYIAKYKIFQLLGGLLPSDKGPMLILYFLVFLIPLTILIYWILYNFRDKLIIYISFIYSKINLIINFYNIRLDVIQILKWNNFIGFILTTYVALTSLYYSASKNVDLEILGIIILFTLITAVISIINNYYLSKMKTENDYVQEYINQMEFLLDRKINSINRNLKDQLDNKFNLLTYELNDSELNKRRDKLRSFLIKYNDYQTKNLIEFKGKTNEFISLFRQENLRKYCSASVYNKLRELEWAFKEMDSWKTNDTIKNLEESLDIYDIALKKVSINIEKLETSTHKNFNESINNLKVIFYEEKKKIKKIGKEIQYEDFSKVLKLIKAEEDKFLHIKLDTMMSSEINGILWGSNRNIEVILLQYLLEFMNGELDSIENKLNEGIEKEIEQSLMSLKEEREEELKAFEVNMKRNLVNENHNLYIKEKELMNKVVNISRSLTEEIINIK